MALNAEQLKNMLDKGFVLFSKNGIIITTQDGKPIQKETRQKEKI